jgi:hypothetical protein
MPQGKDRLHKQARRALENEGWRITSDPFTFRFKLRSQLRVDLAAELGTLLEAQQGQRQIAVEVKPFDRKTLSTDIYIAVGQYYCYHSWLRRVAPNRVLYLAVPIEIVETVFQQPLGQSIQEDHGYIRLIGFNPATERIEQWIEID